MSMEKELRDKCLAKMHDAIDVINCDDRETGRDANLVALINEVSEEQFESALAFGLRQVVKSEQPVTGVAVNRLKDEPLRTVAKLADA